MLRKDKNFTNDAIGFRVPDRENWHKALREDPVTNLLLDIVENPVLSKSQGHINNRTFMYGLPACMGQFSVTDEILYMKEVVKDNEKFVNIRIFPASLVNSILWHVTPNRLAATSFLLRIPSHSPALLLFRNVSIH